MKRRAFLAGALAAPVAAKLAPLAELIPYQPPSPTLAALLEEISEAAAARYSAAFDAAFVDMLTTGVGFMRVPLGSLDG